jgi:hypothetical protein
MFNIGAMLNSCVPYNHSVLYKIKAHYLRKKITIESQMTKRRNIRMLIIFLRVALSCL